jgi:hypothetical protein
VKEHLEKVDILVNNAGIGIYGPLDDLSIEDYDAMMNSNMRSTYFVHQSKSSNYEGTSIWSYCECSISGWEKGIAKRNRLLCNKVCLDWFCSKARL